MGTIYKFKCSQCGLIKEFKRKEERDTFRDKHRPVIATYPRRLRGYNCNLVPADVKVSPIKSYFEKDKKTVKVVWRRWK